MELSNLINDKFKGNYQALFTHQSGYLQKDKNWTLTKKIPKENEKLKFFTDLAQAIVEEGIDDIQNPQDFIKRINEEWTPCVLKDRKISLHPNVEKNEILFSSKISEYSYLSNFFPSLLVVKNSKDKDTVYYSSEHAYMSWKISEIDHKLSEKIAKGVDPKKAKQEVKNLEKKTPSYYSHVKPLSNEITYRENDSIKENELSNEKSGKEKKLRMFEILKKKFSLNPILKTHLSKTGTRALIEHTKDLFWGDGKLLNSVGKNYLGRLLMEVRKILNKN